MLALLLTSCTASKTDTDVGAEVEYCLLCAAVRVESNQEVETKTTESDDERD